MTNNGKHQFEFVQSFIRALANYCGRFVTAEKLNFNSIAQPLPDTLNASETLAQISTSGITGSARRLLLCDNTATKFSTRPFSTTTHMAAAPKKRRSLAVRRRRMRANRLEPRTDIEQCVACDGWKLREHLCGDCLAKVMHVTEAMWTEQRELGRLVEEQAGRRRFHGSDGDGDFKRLARKRRGDDDEDFEVLQ